MTTRQTLERQIAELDAMTAVMAKRIAEGGPMSEIIIFERHALRRMQLARRLQKTKFLEIVK